MARLTCYFDKETAVIRGCCTFDRESDTEPDDCISCGEMCEEHNSDCSGCPIQAAFNKLAEYEDLEEQGLLVRLKEKKTSRLTERITDMETGDIRAYHLKGKSPHDVSKAVEKLGRYEDLEERGLIRMPEGG